MVPKVDYDHRLAIYYLKGAQREPYASDFAFQCTERARDIQGVRSWYYFRLEEKRKEHHRELSRQREAREEIERRKREELQARFNMLQEETQQMIDGTKQVVFDTNVVLEDLDRMLDPVEPMQKAMGELQIEQR